MSAPTKNKRMPRVETRTELQPRTFESAIVQEAYDAAHGPQQALIPHGPAEQWDERFGHLELQQRGFKVALYSTRDGSGAPADPVVWVDNAEDYEKFVLEHGAVDAYANVNPSVDGVSQRNTHARGKKSELAACVRLVFDLDGKCDADWYTAIDRVYSETRVEPTRINQSGADPNGLHVEYDLDLDAVQWLATPEHGAERQRQIDHVESANAGLRTLIGKAAGAQPDKVDDVSRALRIPGTRRGAHKTRVLAHGGPRLNSDQVAMLIEHAPKVGNAVESERKRRFERAVDGERTHTYPLVEAERALERLGAEAYSEWRDLVWALAESYGEDARALAHQWARSAKNYDAAATDSIFDGNDGAKPVRVTAGTLFERARDAGWAPVHPQVRISEAVADGWDGWRQDLIKTYPKDKPPQIAKRVHNASLFLKHHPDVAGVLAFNALSDEVVVRRVPNIGADSTAFRVGDSLADHHEMALVAWLERVAEQSYSVNTLHGVCEKVARSNVYHPIRDYLESLVWDGERRLDSWLHTYMGADDSPYTRQCGAWWMMGAVARVYEPGQKVDYALIFEGKQGGRKSSALRTLAVRDAWFSDSHLPIGTKDGMVNLAGVWIYELGELEAMRRSEVESVKSFLTQCDDHFRPPYGRNVVRRKRQTVFAGTTNDVAYLKDSTGNRRFWPVRVSDTPGEAKGCIRLGLLRKERDQLWAEAVARFKPGLGLPNDERPHSARWWPSTDAESALCEEEQAARAQAHPWKESVEEYVSTRDFVATAELLELLVGDTRFQKPHHAHDLARVMAGLGWRAVRNPRTWRDVAGRKRRGRGFVPIASAPSDDGESAIPF